MVADCGKLGDLFRVSPFLKALGKSFQPRYGIAHYSVSVTLEMIYNSGVRVKCGKRSREELPAYVLVFQLFRCPWPFQLHSIFQATSQARYDNCDNAYWDVHA